MWRTVHLLPENNVSPLGGKGKSVGFGGSPALPVSPELAVWPCPGGRLASLEPWFLHSKDCGEKTQSPQACLTWQRLADLRMAVWDGAAACLLQTAGSPPSPGEGGVCNGWGAAPLLLSNSASLSPQKRKDPKYWRDPAQQTLKRKCPEASDSALAWLRMSSCSWEMVLRSQREWGRPEEPGGGEGGCVALKAQALGACCRGWAGGRLWALKV